MPHKAPLEGEKKALNDALSLGGSLGDILSRDDSLTEGDSLSLGAILSEGLNGEVGLLVK